MKRTRVYWQGRHVVVTGASSGIGRCTVDQALALGARVTAVARESDRLDALRRDGRVAVVAADVSVQAQVLAALTTARERHGPVGALVTSAGVGGAGRFEELPDADFERAMAVNYFGTLHPVRDCVADLRATGGSITCVSSVAGFLGVFGYSAYAPSKFAVRGLCEVLRSELRPAGVSVTVVYPPDVDTPMLAAEQPTKPPELLALSSGEGAMAPEAVARILLAATVRGRASVYPGATTPVLRWLSGAAPGLTARIVDGVTDRAARP